MKTNASIRLIAVAALLLPSIRLASFAQTTTEPVGFMTLTIPAAPSSSTPSYSTISVPLYNPADFTGAVASVDSTTSLTLSGAAWTAGQFADAANPRLVRVKTSATASHVGKYFVVTANTANQLTVRNAHSGTTDITGSVSAGDTCEVLPANTLAKLFGPNDAGATGVFATGTFFGTGASASASTADNLLVWTGSTWATYYNNNTNWKTSPGNANKNDDILYPGEGIFVVRRATTALTLTLQGKVPTTAEQTTLAGNGSTFIPNRFPTDTTLVATGIQSTPGWITASSASSADKVFIWEGGTWATYYHNGTNWKKSPGNANLDTKLIPAGTALFISKTSGDASLTQNLPYTP